jgi:AraC-like DNA-binding protein
MQMSEFFIQKRLQNHKYVQTIQETPFCRYQNLEGWIDSILNQDLVFSHRNTWYTCETFTEKLHAHDYYELAIYIKGNVEYVNENTLISPSPYTVVWFKPGQMHTSRLLADSQYERYLLYFSNNFFSINGKNTPITNFMEHSIAGSLKLSEKNIAELATILKRIDKTLTCNKSYKELLINALLIELFDLLNSPEAEVIEGITLNDTTSQIKQYVDAHYTTITSVNEIAEHFFYSREHLSRAFKESFNISVAQYLSRKRVLESLPLLPKMGATNAGFAVGFRNHTTFINAFKKIIGCLPSEYKPKL